MKQWPIWFFTLLALGVMNIQIYTKEQTLKDGRTVLLELAPVDPRSLMQGDYMQLRYAIFRQVKEDSLGNRGYIVVTLDPQSRGKFSRIHRGDPLSEEEQLIVYRNRNGMRLGAESFFFQEGKATHYDRAKFGELKVNQKGRSVLVGLRDKDLQVL